MAYGWQPLKFSLLALVKIVPVVYSRADLVVNTNKCTVFLKDADLEDIEEFLQIPSA